MEKISIRRPIGSTNVGDVIPGIGTVEDVFGQGDKDICVVRHGDFGTVIEAQVQKIMQTAGETVVEPRVETQEKIGTILENVEMSAQEVESEELIDEAETDVEGVEQETVKSKKSARKLKIAAQKKNKQVLDQSPTVDSNKQLLRG